MRRANKVVQAGHISNDQYCQLFRVFRVQHEAAVFALLLIEALGERHPDPVEIDRPEHPATLDRGRDPRLRAQPPHATRTSPHYHHLPSRARPATALEPSGPSLDRDIPGDMDPIARSVSGK